MSALLTYRKNIRSIEREIDARELATRVFPKGAAEDGYHMTMADHRWEVVAINGATVQLGPDAGGDPIRFERQVDGLYARKYPTTAQWTVLSCDPATQEITLDDVPDTLVVGDYIQFRQGGLCFGQPGADLVYLDRPPAADTYNGIFVGVVDRADIPPLDNLVPNAWLEEWGTPNINYPDGQPMGFSQVTGAVSSITRNSSDAFREYGHYSAFVSATYELGATNNPGIETGWIDVHPTAERPYFSFQAAFFILVGTLRMEIDVDLAGDGSEIVRVPDRNLTVVEETSGKSGVRSNVFRKLNVWTFAGIGGINLWDDPAIGAAKRVKLRVQREGLELLTQFYLDAVQITQTAGGSEHWYDRLASNALWHAANDELERRGEPLARYAVNPLDLFREDPDAFQYDELFRGGRVRVRDVPMGIDVAARIQSLRRDLTVDGQVVTDLELTNRSKHLGRRVTSSARPRTQVDIRGAIGDVAAPTPGGALSGLRVTLEVNPDGDGVDYEVLEWDHNQVVEDGGARFTVDITSTIGGALTSGRDPTLEYGGTDAVARRGSYRTAVTRGDSTDPWRVNVYTVELNDGAVLAGTYQTSRSDFYV